MCGITGYWKPGASVQERTLRAMMRTLHHRGPDGDGVFIDEKRGLAMGHTRLSIIDLDTGSQPISNGVGSITLTVNGEFYDYKRIRATLACDSARFTTKSDSEIAIPLYERHGMDFVDHLRGEFAFALFDHDKRRLVLVRDRFGVKPLYYRMTPEGLYYGSEVKSILANPDVEPKLDPRAALHQMMQVMKPGTTSFQGVDALLPGHMLIVEERNGKLEARTRQYWDFTFPEASDHDASPDPDHYIERVRELLIDSIATRLEADVPVGCYLSGGIDSCTILGLASPMQQSPVKAFTIAFDHSDYDESHIAKEMAESADADQELLHLTSAELYGHAFETTTRHAERTFYNTLAVAKWRMSKRVRENGYKVVITGEGSDELFGGYPFFKRDLLLHAGNASTEEALKANGVFSGAILAETQQTHDAWNDLCGFTPSWIQPWMLTLAHVRELFSDDLRDVLEDYDPIAAIAETIDPAKVRGRHPLDIAQYTWSKTMLEGQILTWGGDRVDMANSMESRPAFLDHLLAEFATRIPPELRIRNGVEKWVLREAAKGVLPRVLYEREKFAFMAPPSHTDLEKASARDELINRWLSPERIENTGLFDRARTSETIETLKKTDDPILSRRADIILNHLIQLHILDDAFSRDEAESLAQA